MASRIPGSDVPLPLSDEDNWDGRQHSADRQQSAPGPKSTNDRSWPEYPVVSSTNSNRREMRSIPKQAHRHDVRYGE